MQILNIDAFASPNRALSYKGKQHPVVEISVQSFIDNLALAERLEKEPEGSISQREAIENAVKSICDAIPTLTAAEVGGFRLAQLLVVLQFIRGELDEQAIKNANDAAKKVAGEGGKTPAKKRS